jgi:APA family basic amino acid/polyamine antiporter
MNSMIQTDQLKRRISLTTATSIVVANMIGTGILTTSGIMAANLPGPGWVLLCWLFGGLIAICGALCYAELATRMPEEGGEYVYLKKLYHPILGFLTGWTSFFVGFSAPIAASSFSFAEYIFAGFNIESATGTGLPIIFYKKMVAALIILTFTFIHYLGVKLGSRVQNILTALKIVIVLGLASIGLIIGSGNWSNITFQTNDSFNGIAIGTAMMLVMFSYSGWNASAYIAGELKNPRKTLPISLIIGTLIVVILYLAINLFIFQAVPYSALKNVIAVVELASVKAFGDWMGNGLSLLVSIALLSSTSAFILIGPRVYFAMAQDRLFFPFAAKVHPRYRVPGKSILIQGVIAIMMVVIGSFEQLLIYIGFALGIFPWLAIAGLFIARKKQIGEVSSAKVWGYPVIPIFYLLASLILMTVAYINRPMESTAAVITVLLGIPCYFLWVKGVKFSTKIFPQ